MTDQIDFKSKRALVIDDFPGMRTAFKAALASFGMSRVDLAASGDEALMRVKNTKYDIIISDYNLGDAKDGQQVLEEMRYRKLITLGTVYLMVTAESVYERVVAAAELAPDDYLIKPFNGEILRNRLEAILFKKQAFREVHKSFANGDLERALSECNVVIKTNPKCLVDAMRLKGEILIAMGDLQAAGELYSEISAMRAVPWSRLGLAKTLHLQRKEEEAEEVLSLVLENHPGLVAAYDLLADVQLAQNRSMDAQATLTRATQVSAKSARRQRRLGEVAYQNKDLKTAEVAFKGAIEKGRYSVFANPNDVGSLARVYLEQDQPRAAGEVLIANAKQLAENDEGKLVNLVVKSALSSKNGNQREAQALVQEALRLRKAAGGRCSPDLAMDMVQVCVGLGMEQEAGQLLEEVASNAHDSTDLLNRAKDIYRDAGKESVAQTILQKATGKVAQLSKQGALLMQAGDLVQGADLLKKASEAAPRNPRVLMNAVWATLRLIAQHGNSGGRLGNAKRMLGDAAELAPDHPRLAELRSAMREVEKRLKAPELNVACVE